MEEDDEVEQGIAARIAKDQLQSPASIVKVMMNAQVLRYLLGDVRGSKILASERSGPKRSGGSRPRSWRPSSTSLAGVKRFEIVSHLRDKVKLVRAGEGDGGPVGGRRLFEFGDSAQVLNNAVNATVLFLDLRGFTKTSEGQISERDLAQELYTVFDGSCPTCGGSAARSTSSWGTGSW